MCTYVKFWYIVESKWFKFATVNEFLFLLCYYEFDQFENEIEFDKLKLSLNNLKLKGCSYGNIELQSQPI